MTSGLRQRLRASAIRHADRPALWVAGQTLTYGELFDRAERLAEAVDRHVEPGGALGIHCQRDLASLTGILAAVLSGRSYLPLNPSLPEQRLAKVLQLAAPRAILSGPDTVETGIRLAGAAPDKIAAFDSEGQLRATGQGNVRIDGEDGRATLYTMFTSGTTGEPKGVRVLDENVEAYIDNIAPVADLTETDRASHFFDLSFDLSAHDIFVTFMAGAQLNVLPRDKTMAIVDFAAERALTSWFSVTAPGAGDAFSAFASGVPRQ